MRLGRLGGLSPKPPLSSSGDGSARIADDPLDIAPPFAQPWIIDIDQSRAIRRLIVIPSKYLAYGGRIDSLPLFDLANPQPFNFPKL
jgi:hypothetical protein